MKEQTIISCEDRRKMSISEELMYLAKASGNTSFSTFVTDRVGPSFLEHAYYECCVLEDEEAIVSTGLRYQSYRHRAKHESKQIERIQVR